MGSLEWSENPTVIAGTEILVVALVKGSLTEPGQMLSLVTEQRVINARWQTDPTTRIRYLPDSVVGIRLTQVGLTNLVCQVDSPLHHASSQSGRPEVKKEDKNKENKNYKPKQKKSKKKVPETRKNEKRKK